MNHDNAIQRVIDILSIDIISYKQEARSLECNAEEKDCINDIIDELDYVRDVLEDILHGKR